MNKQYLVVYYVPSRIEESWAESEEEAAGFAAGWLDTYGYDFYYQDRVFYSPEGRKIAEIFTPEQVREMRGL